ncbi:MAG TPA: zf-HC2 domain-containing protein [Pyrinomonadaceae bacterium]|nr:zf-HC2 domain-containing protein [Pyrinomonadaceae bacterium]
MRCEDCLTVVEEYFDGELNEETETRVAAHLAACAECSEALDALAEEQTLYARYDREIEPSPALWQAVSARIAEADEARATGETFSMLAPERLAAASVLTRWRERVASLFALPSLNPALAGGVALVAVCAFAGWLWFGLPRTQSPELVNNQPSAAPRVNTAAPASPDENRMAEIPGETIKQRNAPAEIAAAVRPEPETRVRVAAPRRVSNTTANASAGVADEAEGAVINHEHATPNDVMLGEVTIASAAPRDPAAPQKFAGSFEELEVARHLERAQIFLRTFSNVTGADDAAAEDIAYEKRGARELLSENIVLRRESADSGPAPTKQLLDALEPFLLDIANLEDKPSNEDLRHIKERMAKKEIIAALRVY